MLPKIIYTKGMIFRYYTGFSFFVFIWISEIEINKPRLLRHEHIHYRQQLELLFILHWLLYGLFYAVSRIYGHGHYIAYRYNPFELEAYSNDNDTVYLYRRKPFAWVKYMNQYKKTFTKEARKKTTLRNRAGWGDNGIAF